MNLNQGNEGFVVPHVLPLKELDVLPLHLHQFPSPHPAVPQEEEHLVGNPGIPELLLWFVLLGLQPLTDTTGKGVPFVWFPRIPTHLVVGDEVLLVEGEFR